MPQPKTSLPFDMISRVASCSARSSGLCSGNSTRPQMSRSLGAFLDARPVVDDKADMPPLDPGLLVVGHARQIDELVAHVDESGAFAAAAQIELEDLAVPVQRLVDVADLDRDMVDADQAGLLAVAHLILPRMNAAFEPHRPAARKRPGKFTTETPRPQS